MPSKPERCTSWTEHTAFPAPSSRVSAWRTQLEDRGKNQILPSKVNRFTNFGRSSPTTWFSSFPFPELSGRICASEYDSPGTHVICGPSIDLYARAVADGGHAASLRGRDGFLQRSAQQHAAHSK